MTRLRDSAERLVLANYPLQFDMRAAFGDVDAYRHLNNVALSRFLEEGRASLSIALFGVEPVLAPLNGEQILVANVNVDYVSQGTYPGMVTVAAGFSRFGRSSFNQACALFQQGRCVALCEAAFIYAVDGVATPIPASLRERARPYALKGAALG